MDRYHDRSLTQLQRHALLPVVPGIGKGVAVYAGSAWVTQQGDPDDHVLGPGESMVFSSRGLVVLEALEATSLVVFDASPERPLRDAGDAQRVAAEKPGREQVERQARALRRQAMADAWCALAKALRQLVGHAARRLVARKTHAPFHRPYHAPLGLRAC